jgi:hypothetical protein
MGPGGRFRILSAWYIAFFYNHADRMRKRPPGPITPGPVTYATDYLRDDGRTAPLSTRVLYR